MQKSTIPYPKKIIVDFDGTLCENKFPEIGKYQTGAREALQTFRDKGCQIVIHSVRTAANWGKENQRVHALAILRFLELYRIPYDKLLLEHDKPFAAAYIDDRGVSYRGNWEQTLLDTLSLLENK